MSNMRSLALRVLLFVVLLAVLTGGSVFFRVGNSEVSAKPQPADTAMTADGPGGYDAVLPAATHRQDSTIATTVNYRTTN